VSYLPVRAQISRAASGLPLTAARIRVAAVASNQVMPVGLDLEKWILTLLK
jgi:hypothetical protein